MYITELVPSKSPIYKTNVHLLINLIHKVSNQTSMLRNEIIVKNIFTVAFWMIWFKKREYLYNIM